MRHCLLLTTSFIFAAVSTACAIRALRRRYHDRLTDAYCEGFRDGVAYEVKVQAEQGKRALVRAGMSVN